MVELKRLRVVFHPRTPDERIALDDVDLSLEPCTFTVVIGTNGAGKSTLLNVIAGSIRPAAGSVVGRRTDVTAWPVHRRAASRPRLPGSDDGHRAPP